MNEVRLAAKAYYENSSAEFKTFALKIFAAMDANGDGRVSSGEFALFLQKIDGCGWIKPSMFAQLDGNGDGTLDFWEVTAFTYLIKMRAIMCDGCSTLLPGLFFTCVTCFYTCGPDKSFDLCTACYGGKSFRHEHSDFMDNYVMLRNCKKEIVPQKSKEIDRTAVHIKRAERVLTAVEVANDLVDVVDVPSNLVDVMDVASTLVNVMGACSIM